MAVIGIDLGTTNSLGCVYRNGKTELIPNAYGSYLTPSVVSMTEDGKLIVGQPAKDRLITHPERTVSSFKKDMGTGRSWKPGEKSFLPEELSSLVIRSIVEDAQNYLGEEIEEAVISVPAYFHDEQRVAVKRAGALAGIHVERIVNEPSAAALASYFTANEEQNMLVFDFGGGTLDVSLVDCFDTMVEIVSVAGNNRLGGDDFDRLIAEHFLREHGVARQQLRAQEYAVLLKQAERCKKLLSEQDEVVMHATVGDQLYESTYTMDRLFEESKALLKEIRQVIGRALKDGKMTIHDVDLVVMAGGSSKMPLIQKYIRHLFHKAPMVQGNCDELIALGLGLVCGVKERKEEIKDYILTDICPFSLGVATINEADPDRAYMANIINRNTVLPCSRVRRFYTASDQQDYVVVEVHQGENTYAQDNLLLGKIEISVPPKPKGKEAVDVRFTYDINGILMVDTRVVSTGVVKTHIISQKIPEAELEERVRELEKLKVHPRDLSENQQMMERLEALYQEVYPEQKEQVQQMIRTFEEFLDGQNPRQIQGYRRYLEKAVSMLEYYDPFNVKESIKQANSFLDGVDRILSDGIENLYIAEYAMQMFTYYTVDKKVNASHEIETLSGENLTSLSGYEFSSSNHKAYKAETEYILWGKSSSKKNVQATVAVIYGIRLLFNVFYALTDEKIDLYATGISAPWAAVAPYLEPIIKLVVKLGLGLCETTDDIKDIKGGYGVSLTKGKVTWVTLKALLSAPNADNTRGTLTFDYSEYLRLFLNTAMLAAGYQPALARIGDCIQVNTDSDITKMSTMLSIEATVTNRTTFMRKIADWSGAGWQYGDSYSIDYKSVLGY